MKTWNKYIVILFGGFIGLTSCNDFLEMKPLDKVTPDDFFWTESDLASYAVKHYEFTTHDGYNIGIWKEDNNTDNQATSSFDNQWAPGELKVKESYNKREDDPWNFDVIRELNYFLEIVLPRYEAGEITGVEENIRHYIGEIYFERAWKYFSKLKTYGDFPIVKNTLPDEKEALIEASKRQPRNEVAKFILSDLDQAISYLSNTPPGGKNRITRNAALLVKSRVALFEASWLTYHKGTSLVPGGPGWPGKDFSGNLDADIAYFVSECKKAAAEIADLGLLAVNQSGERKMGNPYYAQFCLEDMEGCPEILLWKKYNNTDFNIYHFATSYLPSGGNSGFTRQFVETFLMNNGLPIYASGSGYKGDTSVDNVREGRESRLDLFMMKPMEVMDTKVGLKWGGDNGAPGILNLAENRAVTGYGLRKGLSDNYYKGGQTSIEGCPVFRAAEAYLNYIEASCIENNGTSIDSKAQGYWTAIRDRANLPDYKITLDATDLGKESDWGVYSAGQQVSKLLYCIRRERRCELLEEGFRMTDLKRWRALDQVRNYQVEGVNLWESELKDAYKDETSGKNLLIPQGQENPNVSNYTESGKYLRPYQIVKTNNIMFNGYNWCEAHYLTPIALTHFRISATNPDDLSTSVIYQNPGWPLTPSGPSK
ncbi:RagB/SusD family nutrient uptake outer membrane protein [Parabacteroides sp. W1-Q-101]|uniref:RagB/SusD family nutrient uptake outer membrane protein n=1 Tax=Parabacteroides TaxID=375288 RepID=UPI0020301CB6|nr:MULTISPECIES: RagB/SusD family nutrient uptake outer membrane protein [Parabacteroides]MCM0720099.1 RagB/SusD family nutrient uptake outer membrane protein [Parabacteroides sp. W1-Q-101]